MGKSLSANVGKELHYAVEEFAKAHGSSKSETVRTIVEQFFRQSTLPERGLGQGFPAALPTENTAVEWDKKVEILEQHDRDIEDLEISVQALWEALGENAKEDIEGMKDAIRTLQNAFDELSHTIRKEGEEERKKILEKLQSLETVPAELQTVAKEQETLGVSLAALSGRVSQVEEPPEAFLEEEELVRLVLEDEATLDEISGRVLESLAKDLDAEKDEVYRELVGEVRETLSAIRVSDGEKHVRLFQMGQKMDTLVGRIEALTTEVPPREKPKVEARTVPAPPNETYEDILVVCAHGGRGLRTGFTADDRKANVTFCPRCGRRVTYT